MKALHYVNNNVAWGHSSSQLLKRYFELLNQEPAGDILECCAELDAHYLSTRYPNGGLNVAPSDLYTRKMAHNSLDCAEKVMEYVREKFDE